MPALILVCVSCDRHARSPRSGQAAGLALAEALAALTGDLLEVRQVACLNGCPQPCNVALRGAGKPTLRFSQVVVEDGAALVEFARAYWALEAGADAASVLPAGLRAKLTQNTSPPRVPTASS